MISNSFCRSWKTVSMAPEYSLHDWIIPDWPVPPNVHALCTTRSGGCSEGPWSSMNLGTHCGDDPACVQQNRNMLAGLLPAEPLWLKQVHGATAVYHQGAAMIEPEADGVVASGANQVCSILTADCLPVLFSNRDGTRVAAAHAGWRGLAGGVLESTLKALGEAPERIIAWLGPAIGPESYEVGKEVFGAFPGDQSGCFKKRGNRWLMDLYGLARMQLAAAGLHSIHGGGYCTFLERERFYSYRRDGKTGRMACLVWRS